MIYGDGIRLRALEKEDLPHFVRWLNDPEVRDHLNLYHPLSMEDEERWFEEQMKLDPVQRPLSIEIQPSGEEWVLVGNCGLVTLDWRTRTAELGIQIGEKTYWNQGYGTRAIQLLLKYGFQTLNLHRLWLRVYASNPRAIRVYQKAGFIHEGTLREGHFQDGRYVDVEIMSVLREEWYARQEKELPHDA
jgi:RimJ/RimL family protein N-acetyltransferase